MSSHDHRFSVRVEILDGLGRPAELRAGVDGGRAIFSVGREGRDPAYYFSASPSACRELLAAMTMVCEATAMAVEHKRHRDQR